MEEKQKAANFIVGGIIGVVLGAYLTTAYFTGGVPEEIRKTDNRQLMVNRCVMLANKSQDLSECRSLDAEMEACYSIVNKKTEEFFNKN